MTDAQWLAAWLKWAAMTAKQRIKLLRKQLKQQEKEPLPF